MKFYANGKLVASTMISEVNKFQNQQFALGANWSGIIKDIKLEFDAPKGTQFEIDWMKIN